jgi:hypothetical protein
LGNPVHYSLRDRNAPASFVVLSVVCKKIMKVQSDRRSSGSRDERTGGDNLYNEMGLRNIRRELVKTLPLAGGNRQS